jgi:serine/threonine-protein kinase ATR
VGILEIIKGVIHKPEAQASLLYGQTLVWLLDTLQPLNSILLSWPTPLGIDLDLVLQIAIDLADSHIGSHGPESVLYHKASAALVLVCADFCQTPQSLLTEDDEGVSHSRTFCSALIFLAKASTDHAPTSRLVVSGLLPSAHRLVSENPAVGDGTDTWVRLVSFLVVVFLLTMPQRSVHLLTEVTASYYLLEDRSKETQPATFINPGLGLQLQKLAIPRDSNGCGNPVAKRKRLSDDEPSPLLELRSQLCRLVIRDLDISTDELGPRIMYVPFTCSTTLN